MQDVLRAAAAEEPRRLALVAPPGAVWPLPLYELALMGRRRAEELGLADLECVIVTPEAAPLIMFGRAASDAVAELLRVRGVRVLAGVRADERGRRAAAEAGRGAPGGLQGGGPPGPRGACRPGASGRRARLHPDRRARAGPGSGGRLCGGRRHDLPDQAGRHRHAGGGRRRRAHRSRARGGAGGAAVPSCPPRPAPDRRRVPQHGVITWREAPARASPRRTACGGRRTRSAAATWPPGWPARPSTPIRSPRATRSTSRWRCPGSGMREPMALDPYGSPDAG